MNFDILAGFGLALEGDLEPSDGDFEPSGESISDFNEVFMTSFEKLDEFNSGFELRDEEYCEDICETGLEDFWGIGFEDFWVTGFEDTEGKSCFYFGENFNMFFCFHC